MASLIPRGDVVADVMTLKAPDPWSELAARLQAALSADPEWAIEYTKKSPPGPLPWHPKLGLTKDEYERFQVLSKQMRLMPLTQGRLTVREQSKGVFRFDGGSDLPDLTGLELDTASRVLTTSIGTCKAFRSTSVSETAPVGAWKGYSCRLEEGEVTTSARSLWLDFALGRRAVENRGILVYRFKVLDGLRVVSRADVYITYPLPQP